MHKSSDGVLERRQIDQVLVLIEPKPNTIQPSPAAQSILVNIGVRKKVLHTLRVHAKHRELDQMAKRLHSPARCGEGLRQSGLDINAQ